MPVKIEAVVLFAESTCKSKLFPFCVWSYSIATAFGVLFLTRHILPNWSELPCKVAFAFVSYIVCTAGNFGGADQMSRQHN